MWFLAQADDGGAAPTAEDQVQGALDDAGNLAGDALSGDTEALMELFTAYGLPIVWALVILIAALFVGKIVSGMSKRAMTKAKLDETLARFLAKMVYYLILVFGVIFALSKFGIDVTAFAAILAAAGFAVGMALSGTLSNFAAGVMLLIFRPFKVGDVINAAGITAKVNEIELFTTTLDTPDNRRIIVPNGAISGGTIENISFHEDRRCDVSVGCDYGADLDATRSVLEKAAESLSEKMVQGEGRGYAIVLGDLGDSAVGWTVRFWCKAADYWGVKEELTRAVKVHLDEAGIGIPFPQMDIHVDGSMNSA